jgi:carbon monoxide dehydrogenase subunit G
VILENHLDVPADPDAVFALVNDVERVAGCLPGAVLEGQEDDAYVGRVSFKVGPITAAYAGRVRFTEVVPDRRRLRLSARGADSHGHGDAEADVTLTVSPAGDGAAVLDLHTDLVVRGRIAQFGKGAITTVSGRLLDQFARNLADQLGQQPPPAERSPASAAAPTVDAAAEPPAPTAAPVDGLGMLVPPNAGRWAALAAVGLAGLLQGWTLGRLRGQALLIEELRRQRRG